jgi:hypothetical protein
VYSFYTHADISGDYRGFTFHKNGATIAYCHNDGHDYRLACGATIQLNVGDKVNIVHIDNNGHIDAGKETVFMGFFIH